MTDAAELLDRPVASLAAVIASGDVSAVEVTEAVLRRIEERASSHTFITVTGDRALRRAARPQGGALAGVPVAVKDLFDTAGVRTTYGSSIFRDHVPTRTATSVRRLEDAGAIVVGKANLHEFAWGVTSQNPHWGTVGNPTRPGRVAGGSSGGSAAAVADSMAAFGLGTDTGGSIRIPAACCDVVGFKPGLGVVPIRGTFPLAPSFDTVGPIARTVADCAYVYSVLARRPVPVAKLAGLRIGVLAATGLEDQFAALGADVVDAALPVVDGDPTAVFLVECAVTHLPWYPARRDDYGRDLQVKLDAAQRVSALDYRRGLSALKQLRERARREPEVDLLIAPTLGIDPPDQDVWEPDIRVAMTMHTRPFNFLGWPTIAIGDLQIAGRDDQVVLGAALAWEGAHPGTPRTRHGD